MFGSKNLEFGLGPSLSLQRFLGASRRMQAHSNRVSLITAHFTQHKLSMSYNPLMRRTHIVILKFKIVRLRPGI
jgi:hypothetical protein